ncbi:MAG: GTP-binding protein HSR1 [Firmicutes bacterium]|nr:GTP-binding protein HSR1 [Bacillota bacterium]
MNKCLIVGRPNVGKTAFLLSFSRYLGLKDIEIKVRTSDGSIHSRKRRLEDAYSELVQSSPHTTQELQSVVLKLPVGKGYRVFELVDSAGLIDGVHANPVIRAAIAQTIEAIAAASVVAHMFDAALLGSAGYSEGIGQVDRDLFEYAKLQADYFILANKMDLSGAERGLELIRSTFHQVPVFPVSAKTMEGFKEVKRHVSRLV